MSALNFYAPILCPLCNRELPAKKLCCRKCYRILRESLILPINRCHICFFPLLKGRCGFCRGRNVFFDRHLSLFQLNEAWNILLQKWKFNNERLLFRIFLPLLKKVFQMPCFRTVNRVGYIDSGRNGFSIRAYSPCLDLATFTAAGLKVKYSGDVIKKRRYHQSEHEYMARFSGIQKVLALKKGFDGSQISTYLIIEDLFTTGATANEAARLLKKGGVKKVLIVSMLHRSEYDIYGRESL